MEIGKILALGQCVISVLGRITSLISDECRTRRGAQWRIPSDGIVRRGGYAAPSSIGRLVGHFHTFKSSCARVRLIRQVPFGASWPTHEAGTKSEIRRSVGRCSRCSVRVQRTALVRLSMHPASTSFPCLILSSTWDRRTSRRAGNIGVFAIFLLGGWMRRMLPTHLSHPRMRKLFFRLSSQRSTIRIPA